MYSLIFKRTFIRLFIHSLISNGSLSVTLQKTKIQHLTHETIKIDKRARFKILEYSFSFQKLVEHGDPTQQCLPSAEGWRGKNKQKRWEEVFCVSKHAGYVLWIFKRHPLP